MHHSRSSLKASIRRSSPSCALRLPTSRPRLQPKVMLHLLPQLHMEESPHFSTCRAALELRDALLGRIVVEIREHNHVIIERYEEILTRVAQKPKNEEELAALKEFMAKSKEDVTRIMTEAAQVRSLSGVDHRRGDA
jgi:hypothetical protein